MTFEPGLAASCCLATLFAVSNNGTSTRVCLLLCSPAGGKGNGRGAGGKEQEYLPLVAALLTRHHTSALFNQCSQRSLSSLCVIPLLASIM